MEMLMAQTILKNEDRLEDILFNFKIYQKSTQKSRKNPPNIQFIDFQQIFKGNSKKTGHYF